MYSIAKTDDIGADVSFNNKPWQSGKEKEQTTNVNDAIFAGVEIPQIVVQRKKDNHDEYKRGSYKEAPEYLIVMTKMMDEKSTSPKKKNAHLK